MQVTSKSRQASLLPNRADGSATKQENGSKPASASHDHSTLLEEQDVHTKAYTYDGHSAQESRRPKGPPSVKELDTLKALLKRSDDVSFDMCSHALELPMSSHADRAHILRELLANLGFLASSAAPRSMAGYSLKLFSEIVEKNIKMYKLESSIIKKTQNLTDDVAKDRYIRTLVQNVETAPDLVKHAIAVCLTRIITASKVYERIPDKHATKSAVYELHASSLPSFIDPLTDDYRAGPTALNSEARHKTDSNQRIYVVSSRVSKLSLKS